MSSHVVEPTSELSVFMKAGAMAGSEKDAGFCSGGDEDDMSGLHSPSASEDSVEVQVTPISLRNKRKLAEPRKIQELSTAPLKKRRFELIEEPVVIDEESRPVRSPSPFRPWSSSSKGPESKTPGSSSTPLATISGRIGSLPSADASGTISPASRESQEDLTILKDREEEDCETVARKREEERLRGSEGLPVKLEDSNLARNESCIETRLQACLSQRREPRQKLEPRTSTTTTTSGPPIPLVPLTHPRLQEEPLSLVLRGEVPRVPSHPAVSGAYDRSSSYSMEGPSHHHSQNQPSSNGHHHHHHHGGSGGHSRQQHQQREGGQQRNYKNMTRERRIEANARERTRVHTISAAFDTLRRAIPAYSHNQKLSKLSVLRIACSYIMTLGKIVNTPEGESANGASLGACVDLVSRTIQTEGKLRKRKED